MSCMSVWDKAEENVWEWANAKTGWFDLAALLRENRVIAQLGGRMPRQSKGAVRLRALMIGALASSRPES